MLSNCQACVLGALNGLLYGLVSRSVLWIYVEYDLFRIITEPESSSSTTIQVAYFRTYFPVLLAWYVALFTIVSYMAHRSGNRWSKHPLLLWLYIGIAAIAVWNLLGLGAAWLSAWHTGQDYFWRDVTSPTTTEYGLISLVVVMSVNLVFGVIVHFSSVLYGRKGS